MIRYYCAKCSKEHGAETPEEFAELAYAHASTLKELEVLFKMAMLGSASRGK